MDPLSSASATWQVFEQLSAAHIQSFKQAGIDTLQAQLLYNRGIKTSEEMRAFLDARYDRTPDPLNLIDMPRAIQRIQRAFEQREHITVYGDYDADGVTSAALLTRGLRLLGQPAELLDYHIPNRLHDGRGLNIDTLNRLKQHGTSLLITTDCASSDVEQVAHANTSGMDVIITDHHHPPAVLPAAYALVNPWREDSQYGERNLCGAGIAFKLVQALCHAYQRAGAEQSLLDLVAVGTIADVAPLLGENHTLVRLGLQQLNQTQNPGLQALIHATRLQTGRIRERDISYVLAPRLNAAGRMEDASIAFELLTTDDLEQASQLAEKLETLNLSRQQQTETLMRQVHQELQHHPDDQVLLVSGNEWPEGIIGLVAGRLVDEFHRPVFVLSQGPKESRGSARGPAGFNIILALRACAHLFVRYGGHAQAAGFTIANEHVEELHQHLLKWDGNNATSTVAPLEDEVPGVANEQEPAPPGTLRMIDLVFTKPDRLKYSTYTKVQRLGPFGAANPEPIFKLDGLRLLSYWTTGPDGRNLRLLLKGDGTQFNGLFPHGGTQGPSLKGVKQVNAIFKLEPAWNPTEGESKEQISLRVLHVEAVG